MPTPSLILVPARFKTGKLYTPVATTSGGLVLGASGDFNVTRATTATRVNASGLIESVASGIPRLDYPLGGGCPALLVEPQAQNLALQSENFLTTWSPSNITVTTGSTAAFTAPDGTTNADLLTATANGSARIIQSFTFVSGTTYTYSAFAKAGSGFFGLTMENNGVLSGAAVIWNLNTGALTVSGVVGAGYTLQSQGIENYGNGWYRCRMTVLLGLSIAGNIRANTSDGTMSTAIIQSASGNTAYVWGAQLETGSVATSYIPTTTAPITRNADVINLSGAVSGCIGQTEGTLYAEVDIRNLTAGARIPFYLLNALGAPTDSVRIEFNNSNGWQATVRSNNGNIFTVFGPTSQSQGIYKVALGYKSGDSALYINGTQAATDSNSFTFNAALVIAAMHGTVAGNNIMNDRIRAVALYTTRLSNSELATLTT